MKLATTHFAVFFKNDVIIGKPLSKAYAPYVFCDENKEAPCFVLSYNREGVEVMHVLNKVFYVRLVRNYLRAPSWTVGEEASDLTVTQAKLLTIALEKQLLIEKLVYAKRNAVTRAFSSVEAPEISDILNSLQFALDRVRELESSRPLFPLGNLSVRSPEYEKVEREYLKQCGWI